MLESLSDENFLARPGCSGLAPLDDLLLGFDMRIQRVVQLVLEFIGTDGKKIGAQLLLDKLHKVLAVLTDKLRPQIDIS